MEYEQYHQKGGTYVLPVEVFNDLLNEKEELEQENKKLKDNWNKLKYFLANGLASDNYIINEHCMLNKMYELEKSDK